jgi:hypothetical protein
MRFMVGLLGSVDMKKANFRKSRARLFRKFAAGKSWPSVRAPRRAKEQKKARQ